MIFTSKNLSILCAHQVLGTTPPEDVFPQLNLWEEQTAKHVGIRRYSRLGTQNTFHGQIKDTK